MRVPSSIISSSAGGVILGISLGAPMTFLKPITVWRDVVANVRAYGQIHSPEGYLRQATSTLELDMPLLIAGLIGFILMLRQAKTRAVALGWICFAILLIASFMGQSFRPFRSFLPLVPPLCIAAAIAFSELVNWARRGAHRWLRVGITLALLGGCVVSPGYSSFQQARQRMAHQNSRIQAIAWLQQLAGKEKTVLAIRELMILPTEWKRIAASSTVIPWFEAMELLQRQRFDYIVTGEFDLRYASDPNAWAAYRDRWQKRLAILPVQADFGQIATPVVPYLWRTNDERILILGGSMPR
jgi:predicted membrane-bound mannosyltransferase